MWILPTLNRPAQCLEVLETIGDHGCSTPGVVFVNGPEYAAEYERLCGPIVDLLGWSLEFHEKNIGAIGALNRTFKAFPDEPWYGFIADDEFITSAYFDEKLIEAAGGWNIAHGNYGFKQKRAQGCLCIGGELARALGYIAIPDCWHWFGLDDMWEQLAQRGACENIFCEDVGIDHRHPLAGAGEMDECYKLGQTRVMEDHYAFSKWVHLEMPPALKRIERAKVRDKIRKAKIYG